MQRPLLLPLAAAVLAPAALAQTVLVVDNTGGGDHLEIQPAVDAAGPQDLILVEPSATKYAPFTVDAKSVTLVGDGLGVEVTGPVVVQNLAASQRVLLRRLEIDNELSGSILPPIVTLQNNLGKVWLEGVDVVNELTVSFGPFFVVSNSASVVLLRSTLNGGFHLASVPIPGYPNNVPTLRIDSSSAHVFESTVRGPDAFSGDGAGSAVRFEGGSLFLSGCTLLGGDGGYSDSGGFPPSQCVAGNGGSGLAVVGTSDPVHAIDTVFQGGQGGSGPFCSGSDASDVFPSGSETPLPGVARTCMANSPIRAGGGTTTITLTGEPGDAVATLFSFSTESIFSFDLFGSLLVGVPLVVTFHGFFPAGDPTIALPATFAPFPPALSHLHFYLQVFVFTPVGNAQLGSATAVTVLNQVY